MSHNRLYSEVWLNTTPEAYRLSARLREFLIMFLDFRLTWLEVLITNLEIIPSHKIPTDIVCDFVFFLFYIISSIYFSHTITITISRKHMHSTSGARQILSIVTKEKSRCRWGMLLRKEQYYFRRSVDVV